MREALFDILGDRTPGASFLDAYAGTGAIGIEALSRGARHVTFVENNPDALEALRANLDTVRRVKALAGAAGLTRVISHDLVNAIALLEKENQVFDIVFVDPPYAGGQLDRASRLLSRSGLFSEGCLVVAEHDADTAPPLFEPMAPLRTARYGRSALTFFRVRGSP